MQNDACHDEFAHSPNIDITKSKQNTGLSTSLQSNNSISWYVESWPFLKMQFMLEDDGLFCRILAYHLFF